MTQYPAEQCAREVVEVVPLVMRSIRSELRRHRGGDLSVPQFRTLFFLSRQGGASLSEVAEHIGLTLPSMSKIVDGLVTRKLTVRQIHPDDRRRMTLELTARGRATLQSARDATETCLAGLFRTMPSKERGRIVQAMQILRPVFIQPRREEIKAER